MASASLAAALEAVVPAAVRGALHAPAVTAIVADPRDAESLAIALPVVLDALERAGVPRGRAFVLLAAADGVPAAPATVGALAAALGVAVIAHDPAHSPSFTLGRDARGGTIALDDELREAEAVVLAAALDRDPGASVAALIHPGLAPSGAPALESRAVAAVLGVDLCVLWAARAHGFHAWADASLDLETGARAELESRARAVP